MMKATELTEVQTFLAQLEREKNLCHLVRYFIQRDRYECVICGEVFHTHDGGISACFLREPKSDEP